MSNIRAIKVTAAVEFADTEPLLLKLSGKNSLLSTLNENIKYSLNYINAIVHERADKSLVYITNKSYLDRIIGITPDIE